MSVIDFPAIDTEALVDRAEVKDGKPIVAYSRTEAALADLAQRYRGATFDLTTTKGNKAARDARQELVTLRTSLEKRRKEFKAPALEFGKLIDAEAKRITDAIEKLEQPIDAQIKADEERREREAEAKRQAEAARVQAHREAIAKIRAYTDHAKGLPAARIQLGIDRLQGIDPGAEFEEFMTEAQTAKAETLGALRQLHADTLAREEEAARLEAQRQEQARIAAEQKAEAERLAAQRAELERQQAEILAAAQAEVLETAARRGTLENAATRVLVQAIEDLKQDTTAQQEAGQAAAQGTEANPSPCQAQTSLPGPAADEPTIKLGDIGKRLGFNLTEAFVTETLRIAPKGKERAACIYKASHFTRICDALIAHIQSVRNA